MDYLDNLDKSEFMNENNISTIFDYKIYEKQKPKIKETIFDVLKKFDIPEKLLNDIVALYVKIKKDICKKSAYNQINIILSHLDIAYKSNLELLKNQKEHEINIEKFIKFQEERYGLGYSIYKHLSIEEYKNTKLI
jgi:hypothetical protein